MARSHRRKPQILRSDEKSLVKTKEINNPRVKLNLEFLSPNEGLNTRKRIDNSKEEDIKSPKQKKCVSTRQKTVRNVKTAVQKNAQSEGTRVNKTKASLKNPCTNKHASEKELINLKSQVPEKINTDSKQNKQTQHQVNTDLSYKEYEIPIDGKVLRKRKMLDYREQSSIGTPPASENGIVPIYRKFVDKPGKIDKRDPFTFVPDSDEDKSSDISYHINTPKKRKIIHKKVTISKNVHKQDKKVVKYDDKINNTLNAIRTKLNKCKKSEQTSHDIKKSSKTEKWHGIETGVECGASIFCSTPKDVGMSSTRSHSRLSDQNDFNFDNESVVSVPATSGERINIVQNILLDTIENVSSKKQVERSDGSWRFQTDLMKRNPHLIFLKKNSLPNLNQDGILDHTFDDKIGEVNHTVLSPRSGKSPKQQSILNYIPTSKEYSKENFQSQSLFDIDQLSPLKTNNKENLLIEKRCSLQGSLYDIDELSPLKISNEKRHSPTCRVKRNILGQIDSNILSGNNQTSTPNKNVLFNAPEFNATNIVQINESDEHVEETNAKVKPFRFEVNCKTYTSKKEPDMISAPVRDSEVRRLIQKDVGFDNLVEEENLETEDLRLFEDIDVPANITKSYKPRSKKPIPSHNSPKEKKPVKLSREALKWIKDFNHMCDEVDQVELEIE